MLGADRGVVAAAKCCSIHVVLLAVALLRLAVANPIPGELEVGALLQPGPGTEVRVGVGRAKFYKFTCTDPADVMITLRTYAVHADPLLMVSLNPDQSPNFKRHDATSFGQWREDQAGDHYVLAKGVGPRGGIVGIVNMRHFAGEMLVADITIHCTAIVAFDLLFWDHLRSSAICPMGGGLDMSHGMVATPAGFCSDQGTCGKHGACHCNPGYVGPACEHNQKDYDVAAQGRYHFKVATGRYQYFRVRVPPRFPGGFLEVKITSEVPLVVLVRGDDLPTKGSFDMSNFDDWVNQRKVSTLKYKVPATTAGATLGLLGGNAEEPALGRRASDVTSLEGEAMQNRQLEQQEDKFARFVFVGLYNHRRYYLEDDTAYAQAQISLTEDPNFGRVGVPSSFVADLYDPFHDIGSLEITQQKYFPDGQRFIYDLRLTGTEKVNLRVRLYNDRMTLVHLENALEPTAQHMTLEFLNGPNISHILSSTRAAPKTLFDFDQIHQHGVGSMQQRKVDLHANGQKNLWFAIFGATSGAADPGYLEISASAFGDAPTPHVPVGFALFCAVALVLALLALGVLHRDSWRCWERIGMDASAPFTDRFTSLATTCNTNVEDQYLHRGGIGDDGM